MPKHVAVIMDGNGRWAKVKGLPPSAGHQAGVQSLRRLVRLCSSWGIKVLTVFAFSTDNWVRPKVILVFSCFQVQLHYRGVVSIFVFFLSSIICGDGVQLEVDFLMRLFETTINSEVQAFKR